ncbi:type III PLP-dependent enzyme [Desulforamulus aquiferis]|uniref:ornithine decarboxylase n=1 Tax=Desulforamulus aquiferis TaxID=1397668 RepID=A0AAW7Z9J3_9FIRM|nr:type III PLP-dependent enzyme [Desulforamulus aquiferis]MDO7786076.1 type III PLP-dependent enzyme [Desulforamulus aquiferis]RYD05136.1 hypothetical protein N752_11220 [Desulforamulus aquiferis]
MKNSFKLTGEAAETLAETYGTPLLVLSLDQVEENYKFLRKQLPGVKLFYAVKANPDPNLVKRLVELGSCFDVASDGEIIDLKDMGIAPERIVYANPVKTSIGLTTAKGAGVKQLTFDSEGELNRIVKIMPEASVLLRIRIDNKDSLVDLNKKFGVAPEEALDLLLSAKAKGLDVAGLCFHVGSQNTCSDAYLKALAISRSIFDEAAQRGIMLRILDIGGGFPIPSVDDNFDIFSMTRQIQTELNRLFPDTEIWAEPGRFICGTAVNLITKVIGAQVRSGQQWYFLDEGIYGTFSGALFDHWKYEMETFKDGPEINATIAGPSCDSLDVVFQNHNTVALDIDDLILVPNCGAYSSASATTFNGFAKAPTVIWEDIVETLPCKLMAAS